MRVKLYRVHIPAKSSRTVEVPHYDIEIIKLLWPQAELWGGKQIEVQGIGMTEWRPFDAEWNRIVTTYAASPTGGGAPAYQQVFPSVPAFRIAYDAAVKEGEKFDAEVASIQSATATEDVAKPEPRQLDDNLEDDDSLEPAGVAASEAVPAVRRRRTT